jgi:hypothetical protein
LTLSNNAAGAFAASAAGDGIAKQPTSITGMRNIESVGRILIDHGQRVKKINFSLFLCSD